MLQRLDRDFRAYEPSKSFGRTCGTSVSSFPLFPFAARVWLWGYGTLLQW